MKNSLLLLGLLSGALLGCAQAGTKPAYQPATVVSVTSRETPSTYAGNPTDAPLQSEVHSYDVGIQLNCTVYVVRYDTGLDYLPSVFSPRQPVQVSLQTHVMYVNLPGARELRLAIASRSPVRDTSCVGKNQTGN